MVGTDSQRILDLERAAPGPSASGAVGSYTDEALLRMAQVNPEELAALMLTDAMTPWEATFGAEYLGQHCAGTRHAELAISTLLELLRREPSALREGAVYGLRHLRCARVDAALQVQFAVERVVGVRDAIAASLAV